ncbi:serine/threonine protein kinase [Ktedonospora formicarum]|uniref:Protein kinase domain-containing protein n=1 Tax=Ktedonospora formicarum TaxID=2778364 RepID=A0A8J3I3Y3_9CHLR|nr:serine/threonine-protein kinase [Ktedonospora formicarum]GHO46388.1 hypothetical protein KSX_45510 [Ktedonospora formicarum]
MIDKHSLSREIEGYRLLSLLGHGNGSEIYLAEYASSHSPVAVKILPGHRAGDNLTRFFIHATRLKRLEHPYIVRVRAFGTQDDFTYLVMDYLPNGNLRERHPKGQVVESSTVVRYVRQVADAITYLHEQQLIHRDIKPHNMLINAQGNVLLSDFGISVVSHSLDPLAPQQHDFEGTVIYAAPEQLLGTPRRASDQYSLAVTIYEWLSGTWPFSGTFDELVEQHLHHMPPPLRTRNSALSPLIEQVVMKALAKSPEKRFPSMHDFAQAFTWAVEQSTPDRQTPRPTRQFRTPFSF